MPMPNQTPATDQQITDARAAFVAAQQQHGPQHPITVAAGLAALRLMQSKR